MKKFVRCDCGLIMTEKRYYGEHPCESKGRSLYKGFRVILVEDKGRVGRGKAEAQGMGFGSNERGGIRE
jgi:hypothetical protein